MPNRLHSPRNALRIAILTALSAAPVLQAAPLTPNSALDASEFLVNTGFTVGRQSTPRVARDAAGDFVVVWESQNQASSTSGYDIYAQRYDAAGQPQGSAFLVNTFTSNNQEAAAVAMDAAGDFVVAWESQNQASSTSSNDIFAQRFNAAGQPQGSEFQVNTVTSGPSVSPATRPAVAMDAAGDFVVAWQRRENSLSVYDVYARQYTAAGAAVQLTEFAANTFTSGRAIAPAVAMDAAGDFVVAWESYNQASTTSGFDIYARQFNAGGTAVHASEFLVNTFTTGAQQLPSIAVDADGDFVVAWQSYGQAVASSSSNDIYARQYDAAGAAQQANEFLVNTTISMRTFSTDRYNAAVAMDAVGDFVVAWQDNDNVGHTGYDVFARQFTAAGSALQASEFTLSTFTSNNQATPAVAMDAAGDFVAAWSSYDQAGASSQSDIYARRYQGPETVDLGATLATSPSSVTVGGSFSLTLGVDNKIAALGSGNTALDAAAGAASGISAVFTIPSGATLGTTSGTNWACGTVSGTHLTCTYSNSLAAASAASALTLKFTAPTSAGKLAYTAQVTASIQQASSDSSGNSASASVTVNAASSGSSGGGGGAFSLLGLAFLALPGLRRRRPQA